MLSWLPSRIRWLAPWFVYLTCCSRATLGLLRRIPAEDTAGSVREVLAQGDKGAAAIAGRRAAERYGGTILASDIQDGVENFTRFVLLVPVQRDGTAHAGAPHSATASSPGVTDIMVELRVRQMERQGPPSVLKV